MFNSLCALGFDNTEVPCHSHGLRSLNMLRTVKPRFPKLRPYEENWVGRTNDSRNMIVCILIINRLAPELFFFQF